MVRQFLKELYGIWISERPNQLAAALAYYSMFSFAPIIFITVSIAGFFVENIDPAEQLFQNLSEMFGDGFSEITREAVMSLSAEPKSGSLLISAISFIALLYAASGLFFQLQYSSIFP